MRTHRTYESGQTLLELIIAIGIVAIIITALVVAATASLRYGQESRLRSSGLKYAQEAIELARQIRDTTDWNTFLTYSGAGTETWCLDSDNAWTIRSGSACGPIQAGSLFVRSVTFTWNDPIMMVTSQVRWTAGGAPLKTELQTYLTQWQ